MAGTKIRVWSRREGGEGVNIDPPPLYNGMVAPRCGGKKLLPPRRAVVGGGGKKQES